MIHCRIDAYEATREQNGRQRKSACPKIVLGNDGSIGIQFSKSAPKVCCRRSDHPRHTKNQRQDESMMQFDPDFAKFFHER